MEPNITQPTAIDDVTPTIDNVDDINPEALDQLSGNKEEGEE